MDLLNIHKPGKDNCSKHLMHRVQKRVSHSCTFFLLIGLTLFTLFQSSPLLSQTVEKEEKLISLLDSATGEKRIEILTELSKTCRNSRQALIYGREALKMLDRFPNPNLEVNLLNQLCEISQNLGRYQTSRDYAKQSLEIAEKNQYLLEKAEALYYIGRSYYQQGDYGQAPSYLSRARELYKKLDEPLGIAKIQNNFGLIYLRLGNYPSAMDYLLQTLKIYETQGKGDTQSKIGIAYTNNNIGFLYYNMGLYGKALEYYNKAKKIHEKLDYKWGIAIVLNNIAEIYREKKDYNKALDRYKQSLYLKQELGYRHGTATTYHNIGKVYEEMEDFPEALDYFKRALTIREEIDDKLGLNATLIRIGRINRKSGQYDAALEQVNRALEIAVETNTKTAIGDAYQEISEIIAARGDYSKALDYYLKYIDTNNSIFNETSSRRIAELQTQYQIEKKEKEITLLKKDSEIQKLALKQDKNINFFILLTSFLFVIIVIVLYIRWRTKVKMTRILDNEIQEHKRTGEKLHESEEQFRRLAEASIVSIYISQNNVIQYVNPNLLALFGYDRDDLEEQSPLLLVHEEDKEMVQAKMDQRLTGSDDTQRYEFRGKTKSGELLCLESYGGVTLFHGKPAILETVIDITNRKKTAEKLLHSQKMEAMGILAGGIAHDFNNLLIAMVGYLGTLKDKIPKTSPSRETVDAIANAHSQAAELGRLLIDFSEDGWTLPKLVSFPAILNDIIEMHPEYESTIDRMALPGDLKYLYGDERQLKQVFTNLLNNSLENKRSNNSKLKVNISAQNITLSNENLFALNPGEYIKITLQDNGKGIPQVKLENIFEPFLYEKARTMGKGLGLGLAICHSIIKKHHGHISLQSQVGNGTAVELLLPANPWVKS